MPKQRRTASCLLIALACAIAYPGEAHHNTGALFQMDTEITVEGRLVRYDWRNPHLYIEVEATGADGATQRWRFEGQPLAFMRRLGWTRETLAVGDRVTVAANPSRTEGRLTGFMADIDVAGRDVPPLRAAEREALAANAAAIEYGRADSIAGVWVAGWDDEVGAQLNDPAGNLQLTAPGAAAVAAFDEATMHPGLECVPYVAPIFMVVPDAKSIEIDATTVRIGGEFDGTQRTIYLDGRRSTGPTLHGHSVGRFEGSDLIIETTDFTEHRVGLAFGLPSSSRKRLDERLSLTEDGRGMTYEFEMTDPVYLAAPMTAELHWTYRPDVEFELLPCSLDNSRQFLED